MAMNIKFEDVGIMGIIVGIIGAGYGIYQAKKSGDIAKKLDLSLEELEKKTPVEVSQNAVNKAMENAVNRQVKEIVTETAEEVRNDIKKDIKKKVSKEVEENLETIKDGVEDKIDEIINNIDEEKFVNELKADAKKAMIAKYNSSLDGVLSDFKDRFKDLNGIWNYVASCASPRPNYNGGGQGFFNFGG